MLLILRSRAASSLLTGLFGSLRFFSFGTSPARGWRWPTGASRGETDGFAAPEVPILFPLCATAADPPIRIRSDREAMVFFILLLRLEEKLIYRAAFGLPTCPSSLC